MRRVAAALILTSLLTPGGCRSVTDAGPPTVAATTLVAVEENGGGRRTGAGC